MLRAWARPGFLFGEACLAAIYILPMPILQKRRRAAALHIDHA
jgi:hypothetical protein